MKLFGTAEASYYCASYTPETGDAEGSVEAFRRNNLQHRRLFREGEQVFSEYRACSLRDVERCLFFASSHYRRCLDLMLVSGSPWAHVTLYYGAWYSARAILGMFGCTVFKKWVIDVQSSALGQQELRIRKIGQGPGQQPTTYAGTHRIFWDLFYRAVAPLRPRVKAALALGLTPVSNDPVWQISRRNEINYDTRTAVELARDFERSFSSDRFPHSLPGALGTQFALFDALIQLAFSFAKQFGLTTDALGRIGPHGNMGAKIRTLVYGDRPPGLISKTSKRALI